MTRHIVILDSGYVERDINDFRPVRLNLPQKINYTKSKKKDPETSNGSYGDAILNLKTIAGALLMPC